MAVTSPLASLSPPRPVGRGILCAAVMPRKSTCTHAGTEIHDQIYTHTHTYLKYIDTNAQASAASVDATLLTLSNAEKTLCH